MEAVTPPSRLGLWRPGNLAGPCGDSLRGLALCSSDRGPRQQQGRACGPPPLPRWVLRGIPYKPIRAGRRGGSSAPVHGGRGAGAHGWGSSGLGVWVKTPGPISRRDRCRRGARSDWFPAASAARSRQGLRCSEGRGGLSGFPIHECRRGAPISGWAPCSPYPLASGTRGAAGLPCRFAGTATAGGKSAALLQVWAEGRRPANNLPTARLMDVGRAESFAAVFLPRDLKPPTRRKAGACQPALQCTLPARKGLGGTISEQSGHMAQGLRRKAPPGHLRRARGESAALQGAAGASRRGQRPLWRSPAMGPAEFVKQWREGCRLPFLLGPS